jgi:23S rRNA (guanosine2251-2'-O)-methyltransferase
LLAAPTPLIVALDEVTDRRTSGDLPQRRVRRRHRRGAARTPLGRGHRRGLQGVGGAVEHLPIARVRNLADFLGEAKEAGVVLRSRRRRGDFFYDEADWKGGVVVVLGAEGRGLRPRVAASCDALVSLPLKGRIDSLNVSATAAILLYEICRNGKGP